MAVCIGFCPAPAWSNPRPPFIGGLLHPAASGLVALLEQKPETPHSPSLRKSGAVGGSLLTIMQLQELGDGGVIGIYEILDHVSLHLPA